MKIKLSNLIDENGKPIFITRTNETEKARTAGAIAGKRFFNTFKKKLQQL